jgi:hypothetical protein
MNKTIKFRILVSILFFYFSCQASFAQSGGKYTYAFLLNPSSARMAGMGGLMYNKNDQDIQLAIYNPSLISDENHQQLMLGFTDYPTDISSFSGAYAHRFKKAGTFTASLQYFGYGEFTETDASGNTFGTFSAQDYYTQIGWGRKLDSNLSMGANLKFIGSSYAEYQSYGLAADLALTYYNPINRLSISGVVQNAGRQIVSYTDKKEPLPFGIHIGMSQKLKHAPFTYSIVWQNLENWDLTFSDPNDPKIQRDAISGEIIEKSKSAKIFDKTFRHLIFGVEFQPFKAFALRMSYNYQKRQEMSLPTRTGLSGFSWGFGLRVSKFQFSYGRSIYHPAGSPNHITMTTRLSDLLKNSSK